MAVAENDSFRRPTSGLSNLANAIDLGKFYLDVFDHYPKTNRQELAIHVAKYGAKGANLLALQDAAEKLKPFLEKVRQSFSVPKFTLISAEQYDLFRENPSESPEIRAVYD